MGARTRNKVKQSGLGVVVRGPHGGVERIGPEPAVIEIEVVNERGRRAINSLSELRVAEAYLAGDIDLHGDLIGAMDLRRAMNDFQPLIFLSTLAAPLRDRTRQNPRWIAKHYDSGNMQLFGLDDVHHVYTPGIYADDGDPLEQGAERKLAHAFDALGLGQGATLLDVGCGWGGFLRYCAERGVVATGISLSRDQVAYIQREQAAGNGSPTALYQDFFTYRPPHRFDAISLMGSIEDLSDYGAVMRRLAAWLAPGGRVYIDCAARDRPWGIASYVTKYVWPGAFRMLYLPSFTRALARQHFDFVELHNDRRNYFLWAKKILERWTERRGEIVAASSERTWRLMRVLMAGSAHIMSPRSTWASAYRMVLESRAAPGTARSLTARDVANVG